MGSKFPLLNTRQGVTMNSTLLDRMQSSAPKKILAIDGDYIRPIISVTILHRLEQALRVKTGQSELVLSDYFDVIAGTHSGSWLAVLLACGQSMEQVSDFLAPFYPLLLDEGLAFGSEQRDALSARITQQLKAIMGDTTLGSPALRSLIILVLRNLETNSPWPLSNNPLAKYNDRNHADCNLELDLCALLAVSAAWHQTDKPTDQIIPLNPSKPFKFGDGLLTMYGNPAFLAYQMCVTEPYQFNFKHGVENLLLVSVGMGKINDEIVLHPLYGTTTHAKNLTRINASASVAWDMACRTVGSCRFGSMIDREVGDLISANAKAGGLFSYLRYEPDLTRETLKALGLPHDKPEEWLPQHWPHYGQPAKRAIKPELEKVPPEENVAINKERMNAYWVQVKPGLVQYWDERNQTLAEIASRWATQVPMEDHFDGFI